MTSDWSENRSLLCLVESNWSGGVGLVCGMKRGITASTWLSAKSRTMEIPGLAPYSKSHQRVRPDMSSERYELKLDVVKISKDDHRVELLIING
jgi:hypothetical protein